MRPEMKFNNLHWLMVMGLMMSSSLAHAVAPVVIKTYAQHIGGNIVYTHQVTNNSACSVVSFSVGEYTDMIDSSAPYNIDQGELSQVFPLGYEDFVPDVLPTSVSGLPGWTAHIIQIQDSGLYMDWDSGAYPQPDIQPGQMAIFSVTVPKLDVAYLTGHFSASILGDAGVTCPRHYNGVMEKLDVTAPALSISLSPYSIPLAQRGQVIPITATINVSDNYDLAPDIQLVSITANETLVATDVQGATVNTDDRSFSLKAAHTTTAVARIYTVTYSATDASGNKSTVSATVTAF